MQQVILILTLIFSSILISKAQQSDSMKFGTVKVSSVNALNELGLVHFAFFNKENFKKQPSFAQTSIIKNGTSTVIFENIPLGEYAIICFHDENGNDQLDFDENGIPKEQYGVSNTMLNYGPPEFEAAKFMLGEESLSLEIKF